MAHTVTPAPPGLSRRYRRVLWTAALVLAGAIAGTVLGIRIYRAHRPEAYVPGEELADITRQLERKSATPASTRPQGDRAGLRDHPQPLPAGAPAPRFVDVTAAAGLSGYRNFKGRRTSQLPEDMGAGAAWGDFDNDGFEDVFIVSSGGPLDAPPAARAPSLLYRNLGNGHFQKVDAFPDTRILGMGAAWGDYNNDGWLDLAVTGYDTLLLFRNEHGRFVRDRRFPDLKGFWTGVTWGDYDRDGYLDLYVCGYVRYQPGAGSRGVSSQQFGLEVPFTLNPSSYEPERNLLFHNNHDGTFTEVAARLGVDDLRGRSLSALWHDFDGDGWPDLYVANDVSENKFYLNRHGRFVDAGSQAWVAEYRGSMGLAAGDFDRDGDDDLFIAHWIAQQFALYQNLTAEQRSASNKQSELHFTDVAEMRGVGQPSLQSIGFGAAFLDFDSDGWPDLAVANGSTFETKEEPRKLAPMPSFLFWNRRGEFFYDLAPWNLSLATPHASRGLAVADYDNDGALDLLIVDQGEGVRLLRNAIPQGNWLELRLHNGVPGGALGFGDGATVVVHAGGALLRRTVSSASYLSQDSRRVHVGLGGAARADSVEVHWPDGRLDTYTGLAARAIWDLTEGDPAPRRVGQAPAKTPVTFWEKHRAAMDAMKRDNDIPRATQLFREALALDPAHEDARYYLANCLAVQGDYAGALAELDRLLRANPHSHRAWQRKGALLAASMQFQPAEAAVRRALELNQEETGSLQLLGEIALAQGDLGQAEKYLDWTCRANPRAANAHFLRGYVCWRRGQEAEARRRLAEAARTRGAEARPKGTVAEGDVRRQMFQEASFLLPYYERWDGGGQPAAAFRQLDGWLRGGMKRPAASVH